MLNKNLKKRTVDKLISQYGLYLELSKNLAEERFMLIKLDNNEEIIKQELKIKNIESILERFSDEMSFPLPSIWIMYKYLAYKNTEKEISTVSDFVEHCGPLGYVCTERFKFINGFLPKNFWKNKSDQLIDCLEKNEIKELENNPHFVESWLANEFKIVNNKISKWKDC